jgi:hypothetical protein
MTTSVGFGRLGSMDPPIAQHLCKAGYALHIFHHRAADSAKSREAEAKQSAGSRLRARAATPSRRHAVLSWFFLIGHRAPGDLLDLPQPFFVSTGRRVLIRRTQAGKPSTQGNAFGKAAAAVRPSQSSCGYICQ